LTRSISFLFDAFCSPAEALVSASLDSDKRRLETFRVGPRSVELRCEFLEPCIGLCRLLYELCVADTYFFLEDCDFFLGAGIRGGECGEFSAQGLGFLGVRGRGGRGRCVRFGFVTLERDVGSARVVPGSRQRGLRGAKPGPKLVDFDRLSFNPFSFNLLRRRIRRF
jgi:hypothetical protein